MQKKDLYLGIVAMGFGGWMFFEASKLKSGPDMWPKIVAIGIIILGFLIASIAGKIWIDEKKGIAPATPAKKAKMKPDYKTVLIIIGILAAYYILFQVVGYTIPTFAMICGTAYFLGYRKWKVMIPTAALVSIGLYLAFTLIFNVKFGGFFF